MNCKYCGEDNVQGAIYCKKCGNFVDGRKKCSVCGEENSENSVYCKKCGARIDGNKICEKCGAVISADSEFCMFCGAGADNKSQNVKDMHKSKKSDYGKIKKQIGIAIAVSLAIVSLIFVFLLGFVYNDFNYTIYYFFGTGYKEIGNLIGIMEEIAMADNPAGYSGLTNYFTQTIYVPIIFGTVVTALTILMTVIFSTLSIVRGIKQLSGISEKSCFPYAVIAYSAYLSGTVALKAMISKSVPNAWTIVGIVFGILIICAYIIYTNITTEISRTPREIANSIFVGLSAAMMFVMIMLNFIPMFDELGYEELIAGFAFICYDYRTMAEIPNVRIFTVIGVCGLIFMYIGIIATSIAFAYKLYKLDKNKFGSKTEIVLDLCTMFSAVISLIFAILTVNQLETVMKQMLDSSFLDITSSVIAIVPIVLVVLASINFIITLIKVITQSQENKRMLLD